MLIRHLGSDVFSFRPSVMIRILYLLYSLPFIFFVIMLTVIFERNLLLIYIAIGAVSWLDMARIVRGQTISLKRKEFIEAAVAGGVRTFGILRRHIIPNRSEEHTSELQSLMRISYAVFCLKKKKETKT